MYTPFRQSHTETVVVEKEEDEDDEEEQQQLLQPVKVDRLSPLASEIHLQILSFLGHR